MNKKTTSTSRASIIPIRKTGGKAKGSRKGKAKADVDEATVPIETPAPDAVETSATATGPASVEAVNATTPTVPTEATQAPTAESPPTPKGKKKGKKDPKPSKMSALDAAAKVLADSGTPMNCQEMIDAMAKAKLWTSPNGQTPAATLYSAILREIKTKGKDARFKKTQRGKFAAK